MPLIKLNLPPGMRDVGTAHQSKGRWLDGSLVRWVEGVMRPVGKWARATSAPVTGRINALRSMKDLSGRNWVLVGLHNGVGMLTGSTFIDLTPEDFVPGYDVTNVGGGYSAADYGMDEYGTPRTAPTGLTLEANSWSIARWGEFFVAVALSDGRVMLWKPGALGGDPFDTEMSVITQAPVDNRALLVTNERHLMILAAGGNPRKIQWSAREDFTAWTPTALNLAGDLELETDGVLQVGLKVGTEILVMSDLDVFSIRYVGKPFAYGRQLVGTKCGVIGPKAATATTDMAVWMGLDGFYTYRGQVEPLPCDVWDFVFREMNYNQRALVTSGHNSEFSEVWWFFTAGAERENNRYVTWNYRDNIWAKGYLGRTAWQERGVLRHPLAAGPDRNIYEHERRLDDPGLVNRSAPYAISAPYELGNGDNAMSVMGLIPDRDTVSLTALKFTFIGRMTPRQPAQTYGPYFPNDTGRTPTRFTGREITLRVDAQTDTDWRLGVLRAEVKQRGGR